MKKAYKGSFMILFIVTMVLVSPESLAQTKHYIGEKWGGGIVFVVVDDGLHGLIAETKDQGDCAWKETTNLIIKKANHSMEGKAFDDWRLPEKGELFLLYHQRKIVGGFTGNGYWSVSVEDEEVTVLSKDAWNINFSDGDKDLNSRTLELHVRAVRDF